MLPLCSPTQGSMIYDSRPGFRWQAINESDYSCPPGSPRRADASSFVSWCGGGAGTHPC